MDWKLLLTGFLIHLVFFYSIFDVYFTSPLLHGMQPVKMPSPPPAHRLVLFVADGLRADKFFELDQTRKPRAPFLRDIIERHGAWGISHTRVPTESRPGHVALIAGFYEDVSAVAKGWKENPVEFDSVFNRSRQTWSWGSPDILPMFAKGASGDHVHIHMYPGHSEDFAGSDLRQLDIWVFDKLKEFFQKTKQDEVLYKAVQSDKTIFFLHLLGLDTNGHAHNPMSKEYLDNIRVVDDGVREVNELFTDFFKDEKTAYLFTADHGMTNWGSHGAGHPSETLTPLVAWGAGVRSSIETTEKLHLDSYSEEWHLSHIHRSDVNQADICSLMAALIGVPFPVNSVGVLPVHFLDSSDGTKAEYMFANALQILAQFDMKMKEKKDTTLSILFSPFSALTPVLEAEKMRNIQQLIHSGNFNTAISESQNLIELSIEGINYYHNYDRFFLGISILSGYVAWMAYILLKLVVDHSTIPLNKYPSPLDATQSSFWSSDKGLRVIFCCVAAAVLSLLCIQSLPWTYYIYCCLPIALWYKVSKRWRYVRDIYWYLSDSGLMKQVLLLSLLACVAMEIIVLSFFHREILSVALLLMSLWIFSSKSKFKDQSIVAYWCVVCAIMSVFPMMPVVSRDSNFYLVYAAGLLSILIAFGIQFSASQDAAKRRNLFLLQISILILSVLVKWKTSRSLEHREGLPLLNQMISWIVLGLSFITPLLGRSLLYERLFHIVLGFVPSYLLLSTAQEGLFVLCLCFLLFFWISIEAELSTIRRKTKLRDMDFTSTERLGEVERKLSMSDIRCAYFFIFFLLNGFLGVGNIASINTFNPQSVLPFLTVFSPFIMGGLMMWKNLLPLLLVTCAFEGVRLGINVPMQSLFLTVLLMSDFMALNFFFLVRDTGSWLDIGTSISHYVIVMCLILFLMLLLMLSRIFTSRTLHITSKSKAL